MFNLLRYQIFCAYGILFLGLWIALRTENGDNILIDFAPLWLIIVLGIYAVTSIYRGVVNMKDCPEAAAEVDRHVKEAKEELSKKGIIL